MPFAAWVVRQVEPRVLVELGTHSGNSYFSFCQSIAEAGLATKAFAVDTWQGDEHAGHYDESVWTGVNAHNQECYAGFSRLLRMTFDDAVSYFSDGSIDLLHIDGLHTYEAVRHDFETWLPKLAPGAIVMFHDTNVRERGFGVWKLWEELRARYSSNLEFVHSHGLGVLQLDHATPGNRQKWLQSSEVEKQELKTYFAALGSKQLEHFDVTEFGDLKKRAAELSELKQHVENLSLTLTARDAQIVELRRHAENLGVEVATRDARILELSRHAEDLGAEVAARDARILELSRHAEDLGAEVAARDARIADLKEFASELSLELTARDAQIVELSRHAENLGVEVATRDARILELSRHAENLGVEVATRDARILELSRHAEDLGAEVAARDARIADLEQVAESLARDAAAANDQVTQKTSEIAALGDRVRDLEVRAQGGLTTIADMRASTSWRITYPLRALKRLFVPSAR